jgi:hypothetical protein
MAKVVRFKTPQDDVVETLEYLLEQARRGHMTGFVFAAKCPDGNIATSWANVDVGERNELVSHLQVDVMYAVVEANIDRLAERI